MSMKQLNTRIALRSDTHANWELNKTTTLLKGEIGIEIFEQDGGKKKIKIGDGKKTWANLEYFGSTAAIVQDKNPTSEKADIGTIWVNSTANTIFVCVGEGQWEQLGTAEDANTTYTLTSVTNKTAGQLDFAASNPSAKNSINFKGANDVTVSSDDAGNITIDAVNTKVAEDGDGVAVSGADYSAETHTITLHKGFTETPVTVTDAVVEGNGIVTAITKGEGTHTIVSTKGVTYANEIGEGSTTVLPTTQAVNAFVTSKMATIDSMSYKGVVDGSHNLPTDNVKKGDTYKVAVAGTYAEHNAQVGDIFIANKDKASTAGKLDWDLIPSGDDGNTFHDSLTADALVVGKNDKTVKTFANGADGLVLKMVNGKLDWAEDKDTIFTLQPASSTLLGGFETGFTSEQDKQYAVQMSGNKAYVEVPWINTTYKPVIANGDPGLMSGADKKKIDDWIIPLATQDVVGGIKIDSASKPEANVYDVQLNTATSKPFVTVPDTVYTAKQGNDLTLSNKEFNVTYSKTNLVTDLNKDALVLVLQGGNAAGNWVEPEPETK